MPARFAGSAPPTGERPAHRASRHPSGQDYSPRSEQLREVFSPAISSSLAGTPAEGLNRRDLPPAVGSSIADPELVRRGVVDEAAELREVVALRVIGSGVVVEV